MIRSVSSPVPATCSFFFHCNRFSNCVSISQTSWCVCRLCQYKGKCVTCVLNQAGAESKTFSVTSGKAVLRRNQYIKPLNSDYNRIYKFSKDVHAHRHTISRALFCTKPLNLSWRLRNCNKTLDLFARAYQVNLFVCRSCIWFLSPAY